MPSNPFDQEATTVGSNPFEAASSRSSKNPFDQAQSASSTSHGSGLHIVARTVPINKDGNEAENPLVKALSAGSRFGKHIVATGKFGLPDRAGEDQDRATIRQRLHADNLPHPVQGLLDFGIDTALDPTTYAGGILAKGLGASVKAGARVGAPLLAKGGEALTHLPGVGSWLKHAGEVAGEGAQKIGDAFHWGGDAHRTMPPEQYRDATLASNRQGARETELARRLEVRRAGIFDHLNDNQRLAAYKLLNGEVDVVADPQVMAAVKQGRSLLNDAGYIQATDSGRKRLAFGNAGVKNATVKNRNAVAKPLDEFEAMVPDDMPAESQAFKPTKFRGALPDRAYPLAENLREFAAPGDQGVLGSRNIRENYIPGIRSTDTVPDTYTRPNSYNLLHPFAGHALRREDFKIGSVAPDKLAATVAEHDAAIKRYLHHSANASLSRILTQ